MRRDQLRYGLLWGALAFATGLLVTYTLTPANSFFEDRWVEASWYFLSANGIPVHYPKTTSDLVIGNFSDIIAETGQLEGLYALPPVLLTLAAVLTCDSLQFTTRSKEVLQNCLGTAAGYIGAALVTIIISGARPAASFIVLLGGLIGGELFIGSQVVNRMADSWVLGIVTLGGLALLGVAVNAGGPSQLDALLPVLVISAGSVLAATTLLLVVRVIRGPNASTS